LRELAHRELEPFGIERVRFTGDDLALSPKEALALGLILHELVTNAAKHGALSVDHGRLEICATLKPDHGDGRQVVWREVDGPAVNRPDKNGFGMQLVQKEMSHNLRGKADFDFGEKGLRVELRFASPTGTAD
jgi:two-component sensor histidine kinase